MCDPTSQAGASQPSEAGRAWMLPAASVRTSQPADFACAMTYSHASAHAGENVGRVAPAPGVAVHRAIASMSVRIRFTSIDIPWSCFSDGVSQIGLNAKTPRRQGRAKKTFGRVGIAHLFRVAMVGNAHPTAYIP